MARVPLGCARVRVVTATECAKSRTPGGPSAGRARRNARARIRPGRAVGRTLPGAVRAPPTRDRRLSVALLSQESEK
ncbi:hypothetical protein GCM10009802_66610 [Streptomyces synnematoformans]|uniref:Uncharacterized protein n=1 Tax=Streptomyces synnematoformans TaxID=415721 RepID=A0ABP4L4F4_9ACTN